MPVTPSQYIMLRFYEAMSYYLLGFRGWLYFLFGLDQALDHLYKGGTS